jgi:hypothetical protein
VPLLAIPVRAVSPSKSRDEISVRGEDCDTLSFTVKVAVLLQYLTM